MRAFLGSNLLLAGLLATGAAAIFPVVLHSTLAPENSLTAYDVAAGPNSLAYAAVWWPISFALAAAYFVFVVATIRRQSQRETRQPGLLLSPTRKVPGQDRRGPPARADCQFHTKGG